MKLIIEDYCIRCGICIDISADLFEKDNVNDIIRVKFEEIPETLKKDAKEAVKGCAVAAMKIAE